jgi:hypothetical protein
VTFFNASTSIPAAGEEPPPRRITSSRESRANRSRIAERCARALASGADVEKCQRY